MRGEILVPLLVTGVLGDEVQVLAADDEGAMHFGADDGAGEDTATDGDETGEGAFLVCRWRGVLARRCMYCLRQVFKVKWIPVNEHPCS